MKKFKFSQSGKYFVIAGNIDMDTMHVYDSSNIEILLSELVSKSKYLTALRDDDIKETKKVVFSQDEEKIFIGTNRNILIFKLIEGMLIKKLMIPLCYGKDLYFNMK